MQLKDNILKIYLLQGVSWFMVAMPIIILFFQENGFSLTQIMTLQAIYSFSVAIFEIPSGYIADIFGRKKTIVASTILSFIGYLVLSLCSGFFAFSLAQILIGLSGSLMSGSNSALLYDTLLQTDNKELYTKVEGKNYAIGNFSEASAGILGGFLAATSIFLPIYVQTSILFLSIPISLTLIEPTVYKKNKIDRSISNIISIVQFAIIDNVRLRWLIIYSSIMGVASLSMAWFAQPFFKEIQIPIIYFGILWAGLNFSSGITSFNSYKIEKRYKIHKILTVITIFMTMSFILLGINFNLLGLIFILLIYLLRGIITPIIRNAINEITTSEKRATVLSVRSFILRISFAICAPILGYITDNYSLTIAFYTLALIVGIVSTISSIKIYLINK
tara:strand:+ start:6 stop:1175 length:1170 start_codon:yes stop_codon:yes gene_type:complete